MHMQETYGPCLASVEVVDAFLQVAFETLDQQMHCLSSPRELFRRSAHNQILFVVCSRAEGALPSHVRSNPFNLSKSLPRRKPQRQADGSRSATLGEHFVSAFWQRVVVRDFNEHRFSRVDIAAV